MAKILFRLVALITTMAVTSPAWAGWDNILSWVPKSIPELSAAAMLGVAIGGVCVGLLASRQRRQP